ncbi:hypothetical protein HMPREF9243_0075 [Aerococcus sp. Group 1]|nr:hypothetical protein HMPREF9243_0075 [Aerococcus sp. Group 1]
MLYAKNSPHTFPKYRKKAMTSYHDPYRCTDTLPLAGLAS